ncbi:metallophosphoesterase [Gimesia aquarii]|uniref:Serine/threonine-protein phosphatase 1 n=1 Tax=Gimesia aquarii TaxID=2527964 RepID=A0A517X1Q7_9PLAN|nr:metallophosphoesterase [Gimesia aquarii]QDU11429.1 Serine/threonine-protein phosphatase 1 [Gimesia aquarii]
MGRLLAIGDIHGCLISLKLLIEKVRPTHEDLVIVLGDIIARGPESKGCLDFLIELNEELKMVFLMGNHEEFMLEAKTSSIACGSWIYFGGEEVLRSYDPLHQTVDIKNVPENHWKFIESFQDYFETDEEIFVHGMIEPDKPVHGQDSTSFRWLTFSKASPHISGKRVICGHTLQESGVPSNLKHSICIDTNTCENGWLTCLDVKAELAHQTNEAGDYRILDISSTE